jgi:hypothetical protein
LREGERGRGNLKGELFTSTLTLSSPSQRLFQAGGRQGRGNYFKISKSGFGIKHFLENGIEKW